MAKFFFTAPTARAFMAMKGSLQDVLFNGLAADLVLQLVVTPILADEKEVKKAKDTHPLHRKQTKPEASSTNRTLNATATLASLPTQLHFLIASFLQDVKDVMSLGLTDQYFMRVAQVNLATHYVSKWGQWAGQDLLCMPGSDLEKHFLPEQIQDIYWGRENDNRGLFIEEAPKRLLRDMIECDIDAYMWSGRKLTLADPLPGRLFCDTLFDVKNYFRVDQKWILRNLTLKQIVRAEAIAVSPEHIKGPLIEGIGFGEALLSRICVPGPGSKKDTLNPSKGVWFAHRIDITLLSKHEAETRDAEQWTDVSEEVRQEIAALWGSRYGPGWRESHCNNWARPYYDVS